jgi:hypothetical protein
LAAVPVKAPALKTEHKSGKVYVTVEFERPAWQRFLGAERRCRRTFGLDAYGQEVYGACDGKTPVRAMIDRFGDGHRLSRPEAEMAVTTFLKTLMAKGLVGMEMPDAGCRMPNGENKQAETRE